MDSTRKSYIQVKSHEMKGEIGVQNFLRKKEKKESRNNILVKTCFTVVLVLFIVLIWLSLFSPLAIGYKARPPLMNISRTYFDLLKQNLTVNNSSNVCNASSFSTNNSNNTVKCPSNYVFNCPMCVPICGKWHPFGETYFTLYRASTIMVGFLDLIFAILGIVVFIHVPNSLKFPKVFYFIMFATLIALSSVLSVAAMFGPHKFFCGGRNEDYEVVFKDPPIVVTILGVISHYSFISFQFSFCIAVLNIFIVIYFPHWQILKSTNRKKILLTIELCICLGIPVLFPVINLAVYHSYSFIRLPTLPFPLGDRIAPFALALGPMLLITGFISTLLLLSIYRVQVLKYMIHKEVVTFKSYEVRMIIFAFEVFLTVLFIFIDLSITLATDEIAKYLQEEYFACITLHHNPWFLSNSTLIPTECVASYKAYMYPVLSLLADIATGLAAVQMLVVLSTSETLEAWRKSIKRIINTLSASVSSSA